MYGILIIGRKGQLHKMRYFNSAIKSNQKYSYYEDVEECNFFEINNIKIFAQDLVKDNLSTHFDSVDFFYTEPPYPMGLKYFNKKAKVEDNRKYDDVINAILNKVIATKKPTYLILGKIALKKLIKPNYMQQIYLNPQDPISYLGVWNTNKIFEAKSTNDLCKKFSEYYNCMGDVMCGYGQSVLDFHTVNNKNFCFF